MAAAHHSSSRASLLSGLRTGGVRSASMSVPHTAGPAGSFSVPRFASSAIQQFVFPEEEEEFDQVSDLFSQSLYVNPMRNNPGHPISAAVDGTNNRFMQQQISGNRALNPNSVPFSPAFLQPIQQQVASQEAQLHAYQQMQLMQLEIIRLQSAQAQHNQQVQAAVLAEALRQQARRGSVGVVPASAGPVNAAFDLRSNTPPVRRPGQAEILKAQLGINSMPQSQSDDQVPMTAALSGRFGARLPSNAVAFPSLSDAVPRSSSPPKQSAMAGPTRSGSPPKDSAPSKSDAATSWRRGNTTHSALNGLRTISNASPSVKITPPPGERSSPPPLTPTTKLRPRPLSFFSLAPPDVPAVAVDLGSDHEDAFSSDSSTSQSNPATPQSSVSLDAAPLSPREEAAKKLYEGLGMGRPAPQIVQANAMSLPQRVASQPVRQPRGPPSGADELGPKNFATRIRRKAIGGLGVLMDARERRESIEVY